MATRCVGIIMLTVLVTIIAGCASPALPTTVPAPMTAERLVDECARAMGGVEKIKSLETMRSTQHFPDHGGLIRYEIKRPNRVRMGDELVFDGERAAWLEGELVPQREWKDFEVDIAWYIPAFFDYPAEYMGTKVVNGIKTHVLQVTLPLGAVMTYNLDARTYLVYKASARFTIDNKEYHPERIYSDYRVQDGILYPHAFTYEGRTGIFTATVETLEFNVPLADERFAVPIASEAPPADTPAPPTAAPETQTQSPPTGSGGGVVAFDTSRGGNLEIYSMFSDGSNEINLTNHREGDVNPAWSPDGNKIAFEAYRDGNAEIYVMNADGSDQERLTDHPGDDASPTWSPDGSRIVFYSKRDGNAEIYVMNADGSNQKRLTNDPADDAYPVWSPDGAQIAFVTDRDGNNEIYVMDTDGHNLTNLTNHDAADWLPAWSPDGAQILFSSERDGNYEIYVMAAPGGPDADGRNPTRLTNNSASDYSPTWTTDGRQIVFGSKRGGKADIYVMNADGSDQKRLTNNAFGNYSPDWKP